jgi:glycerophosphoryl diester phosphodiesterase
MRPGFELQGHRGARGLFPENTLEGFRRTLALGVDSLELDVGVTADQVAVVVHDPVLNPDLTRGPDGAWLNGPARAVLSLTLAELAHFDVGRLRPGSDVAARHPRQQSIDGARIPTLAALFRATAGCPAVIDVELKTSEKTPELTVAPTVMADLVLAAAQAETAVDRLAVRSFDWRGLAYLRRVAPGVRLAWLTDDKVGPGIVAAVAEAASGCPFTPTWAPYHAMLTPEIIAQAHGLGLRVVPWTVNDPAAMARLIGWGVDGLCTDDVDLAQIAMAQAGLKPPQPWHG